MTTFSVRLLIINLIFINSLHAMEHESALTTIAAHNAYKILKGHTNMVKSVAFNPTNNTELASGSFDRTMRIWNLQADTYTTTSLTGYTDPRSTTPNTLCAWDLSYDFDGTTLIVAADSMALWNDLLLFTPLDPPTQSPASTNWMDEGNSRELPPLSLVRISEDTYAVGSIDKIIIFKPGTNGELAPFRVLRMPTSTNISNNIWSLARDSDAKTIVAGAFKKIEFFDYSGTRGAATSYESWEAHDNYITGLVFKDNDTTLISSSLDKTVKLWDIRQNNYKPAHIFTTSDQVSALAYAPNLKQIAAAVGNDVAQCITDHYNQIDSQASSAPTDGSVQLWDLRKAALYTTLQHDNSMVASVAYSPNETQLACGQTNGNITVWDINT